MTPLYEKQLLDWPKKRRVVAGVFLSLSDSGTVTADGGACYDCCLFSAFGYRVRRSRSRAPSIARPVLVMRLAADANDEASPPPGCDDDIVKFANRNFCRHLLPFAVFTKKLTLRFHSRAIKDHAVLRGEEARRCILRRLPSPTRTTMPPCRHHLPPKKSRCLLP